MFSDSDKKRFWNKVNKSNECWEWTASLRSHESPYGVFWFNNKNMPAPRISWMMENGEIPEGMIICHTCDNPKCVRLDHLWLGTPKQNTLDAVSKNRMASGERTKASKLNDQQREELIDRWIKGEKRIELAKEYNITDQAVHYIVSKKKDLPNAPKNAIFKKLTPEQHHEILIKFNNGENQENLAKEYKIAKSSMGWIIRHKFKHETVR